jgi:hypothetical protein
MTSPFVYNPQRDAWKAIRGFYYQVELTVIRWLELQADTILHCECGEDIDHVRQLLDTDEATSEGLLSHLDRHLLRLASHRNHSDLIQAYAVGSLFFAALTGCGSPSYFQGTSCHRRTSRPAQNSKARRKTG